MRSLSLFFQLFISFVLITGSGFSQVIEDEKYIPGEVLVRFKTGVGPESINSSFRSQYGVQDPELISKTFNIWLLKFNRSIPMDDILKAFRSERTVDVVQMNHYVEERIIPNDPSFTNQWEFQNNTPPSADIEAQAAWDITTGGVTADGDTIVVAVIDGGFALNHPDLNFYKNRLDIPGNSIDDDLNGYVDDTNGWNAYLNSGNITSNNHGTHVSGTVGARGNNGVGVTGVNWNVKVMAIQGSTSSEAVAVRAYTYVYDMRKLYNQTSGLKGAFVVSTNSSFGVDYGQPSNYPLWCAMYDSLGKVGILSAGATANRRVNVDAVGDIPTACPSDFMVAVTNTTNIDSLNGQAAYGQINIDLGAPGTGILSTTASSSTNFSYGTLTGTSMATPHVAGAIGLMYAAVCSTFIENYKLYPDSFALVMKDILLTNVDTITSLKNITVSDGRLNLYKSVKGAREYLLCPASVDERASENVFVMYPNPSNESVIIENANGALLQIFDVAGRLTFESRINQNRSAIDLSSFQSGIYFVRAVKGNLAGVQKLVKE